MQLPKKWQIFSEFFSVILKSRLNFEHFEKRLTLIAYVFEKLQTAKDLVRQMFKKFGFGRPFDKHYD